MAFIAPFIFWRGVYDYAVAPKEAFLHAGILFLLAAVLLRKGRVCIPKVLPPLLLFIVFAGITSLWAVNPYASLWMAACWLIYALAIFIVSNAVNKEHLVRAIYFSALGVCVIGLLQYYFHLNLIPQTMPPASTFANKNYAAHFAAVAFPLGFYLKSWKNIAFGSLVILNFLYIAGSTAAWLAIGIITLFIGFIYLKKKIFLLVLAALITAGAFGIDWQDTTRLMLWRSTINMAVDNPAGVGLENFAVQLPKYAVTDEAAEIELASIGSMAGSAHNEFIQLWAELGYFGIIAMGILLCCAFRFLKKEPLIIASLLAVAVVMLFSNPLRMPIIPFTAASLIGVIAR